MDTSQLSLPSFPSNSNRFYFFIIVPIQRLFPVCRLFIFRSYSFSPVSIVIFLSSLRFFLFSNPCAGFFGEVAKGGLRMDGLGLVSYS